MVGNARSGAEDSGLGFQAGCRSFRWWTGHSSAFRQVVLFGRFSKFLYTTEDGEEAVRSSRIAGGLDMKPKCDL